MKKYPLGGEEKYCNSGFFPVRVVAENIFGDTKRSKIMSARCRNKRKPYNLKFQIIPGIINLKNGFASA